MAKDNVTKFEERFMKDELLQEKLQHAAMAFEGDRTDERAVFEAIIFPIAKAEGLEFTFDEAQEAKKAASEGEIDISEMRTVAGGKLELPWYVRLFI
ncbi:MAG: hypothetical protein K6F86_05895 [Lachnospiraceae bacterium]|nr:hypothetical protein [Lachnospiraceae bacterium]